MLLFKGGGSDFKLKGTSIRRKKIYVVHTNNEGHVVLSLHISAELNNFLELFSYLGHWM